MSAEHETGDDGRIVGRVTDPQLVAADGQIPDDDDTASEGLNPREILLVDALALGRTLGDAATAASISARSGRRWKSKPHIAEAIRARMTENISVGRAILAAGMSKAATGLIAMASGEAVADSARVSACRAVVEGASKLLETDEMVARLAQLEAQLAEHQEIARKEMPVLDQKTMDYMESHDGALPPGMTMQEYAARFCASLGLDVPPSWYSQKVVQR
jgi:hypothetical protein